MLWTARSIRDRETPLFETPLSTDPALESGREHEPPRNMDVAILVAHPREFNMNLILAITFCHDMSHDC